MSNNWNKTMDKDLQQRSAEIHWPEGFEPEHADLFSHNQLVIHASAEIIWRHLVEAPKWPEWYLNAQAVSILEGDKTLKADSTFLWTTFGIDLESKINEYAPGSRLSWYGYAPGARPNFYHTWYIVRQDAHSCLVITEEVGIGHDAVSFRKNNEGLLHRGHDLWLAGLKWISEDDA